jgi:hypothetical protein
MRHGNGPPAANRGSAALFRKPQDAQRLNRAMISIPRTFAGFRSARAVLEDKGLTRRQKRLALQSWRSAIDQTPPGSDGTSDRARLIREIDAALHTLLVRERHSSARK